MNQPMSVQQKKKFCLENKNERVDVELVNGEGYTGFIRHVHAAYFTIRVKEHYKPMTVRIPYDHVQLLIPNPW